MTGVVARTLDAADLRVAALLGGALSHAESSAFASSKILASPSRRGRLQSVYLTEVPSRFDARYGRLIGDAMRVKT